MEQTMQKRGSRMGRVLECLHAADKDDRAITAKAIAAALGVTVQNVNDALVLLKGAGLAWIQTPAGKNTPALWRPTSGLAHITPPVSDGVRGRNAQRAKVRVIVESIEVKPLGWKPHPSMAERAADENRWLDHWIDAWGRWMHKRETKIGYPRQCIGLRGGWLVRESEELADAADIKVIECVDAIIAGLPESQRAAVWTVAGLCSAPEGDWIIGALQDARATIYAEADRRGVVVL